MSKDEATAILKARDFVVAGREKHITFRMFKNGRVFGLLGKRYLRETESGYEYGSVDEWWEYWGDDADNMEMRKRPVFK